MTACAVSRTNQLIESIEVASACAKPGEMPIKALSPALSVPSQAMALQRMYRPQAMYLSLGGCH